jgi:predicted HicB family RNase H-like nuclease
MASKGYGKKSNGRPITEDLITELGQKAEEGLDPQAIVRRRGGRRPMGSGAATVESVRLDPELREALAERARRDQESTSAVIREALRRYLDVA